MRAKAWSFTGLEQYNSCPKQYNEVRNLKKYPYEANTPEAIYGRYAHKAFEDRQATRVELPEDLKHHEAFMQRMEAWPGDCFFTEQQCALDRTLKPCSSQAWDTVWWRGVIDYTKVNYLTQSAKIVDYKTGARFNKRGDSKAKPKQLMENALWTFAMYPDVEVVDAFFYWTQDVGSAKEPTDRYVWTRDQIPELWQEHVPSLTAFRESYVKDSWPAKKSGLCNGWCPVEDCSFWRPKK
jgi:hypothetical protein